MSTRATITATDFSGKQVHFINLYDSPPSILWKKLKEISPLFKNHPNIREIELILKKYISQDLIKIEDYRKLLDAEYNYFIDSEWKITRK